MSVPIHLEEKLNALPAKPGVYLMKDSGGTVIYVGKAVSLRNRVRQYFQSSRNHPPKVVAMVQRIADFEYMVTDSEVEALILECNLIKRYKPWYNVRLKDDKSYPYLKVTLGEAFPRVCLTRRVVKDGSKYFGPFTNSGAVRETLKLVKKLFPLRTCNVKIDLAEDDTGRSNMPRPCLNYHINRCPAPCTGNITRQAYMETIKEIIMFLEGRHEDLVKDLEAKMYEASENLDFERAARLRDQVKAIRAVTEQQKIVSSAWEDKDVIALARDETGSCAQVFFIRQGKLVGREHFLLVEHGGQDDREALTAFVKQYYAFASYVPKEIVLQREIDEMNIIARWLEERRGSKVILTVPKRGDAKKLVDMVAKNAQLVLERMKVEALATKDRTAKALEELAEHLGLDEAPRRIECYDISNIQGTLAVGSMVVFEDGKPKKSDYRRFKIKTVEGPNDFAMIEEVIRRRFARALDDDPDSKFAELPDLVIIDGGKGQLGAARKAMRELGFDDITTCGLAKQFELIFMEGRDEPIVLPRGSGALFLVQRIRDEAHRFAITYHRKLRGRAGVRSELLNVPGIGPKRLKALLAAFGSVEGMRKASEEELAAVEGMNASAARNLYEYLHGEGRK